MYDCNVNITYALFQQLLLEYMLSDACGMDLTISVSSALFALVCSQQVSKDLTTVIFNSISSALM